MDSRHLVAIRTRCRHIWVSADILRHAGAWYAPCYAPVHAADEPHGTHDKGLTMTALVDIVVRHWQEILVASAVLTVAAVRRSK